MGKYLDFVEKISFVRVGGSKEEREVSEKIQREIKEAAKAAGREDLVGERMPFTIPDGKVSKCEVSLEGEKLASVPFLRSGNIDRELKLVYLESGSDVHFAGAGDLSDCAVLLDGLTDEKVYKRLAAHHAAAFLIMQGKYYFSTEEASLYGRALRDHFSRNGRIPGFTITTADAMRLVRMLEEVECCETSCSKEAQNGTIENGASTAEVGKKPVMVHLTLKQEDVERESQDIIAEIPGTDLAEEVIVLTGHYDSVPLGTGSWDNATGAAALLGIFRHFAAHPARRTLRFIWCGSEELGLLGSKAYVAKHEKELSKIMFCFNFDMCGTLLGSNHILVTGDKDLESFADQYCKLANYPAKLKACVHSSDSAPFCDHNIPALGLSRETNTAEIHTIHDLMDTLSERAMEKNVDFAIRMIGDLSNAAVIPFKKEMPKERREELDKYFHRETKEA